MPVDAGLLAWAEEAMAPLGHVTGRAMMGGRTLYCDGMVFVILADDALWFKADAVSDAAWDAAGATRFTYSLPTAGRGSMNYRRAPDDCYDDADELMRWATLALEAGARAPVKKTRGSKRSAD